ncbi:MAG: hypothetical protein ACRDL7_06505, partial [Gaiellaceae bacterium]
AQTAQLVDARILLSPETATNAIGTTETYTAKVQTNDGSGWSTVSDNGIRINFSLTSNNSPSTAAFFNGATNLGQGTAGDDGLQTGDVSCTTTAGSCTVTINDTAIDTVDVHANSNGFKVSGIQGSFTRSTGNPATSTCDPNANATGDGTCDAVKQYDDARILITPEEKTNAAGTDHTVTATLQYSANNTTWLNPGAGKTISFTITPANPNIAFNGGLSSCTTLASGSCSVTVHQVVPQAETIGIRAASDFGVTGIGGTFSVATTASGTGSTCDPNASGTTGNGTCDAIKHYIVGRVILTPENATNIVGNPHMFTATLQTSADGTSWTTISDDNQEIDFSFVGATSAHFVPNTVAGSKCTTSGGTGGCSVNINDDTAETVLVHAASTFSVAGVGGTFTVGTQSTAGPTGCTPDPGLNTGVCDGIKIYLKPTTTEHVTDTMVGLPNDATGSV